MDPLGWNRAVRCSGSPTTYYGKYFRAGPHMLLDRASREETRPKKIRDGPKPAQSSPWD